MSACLQDSLETECLKFLPCCLSGPGAWGGGGSDKFTINRESHSIIPVTDSYSARKLLQLFQSKFSFIYKQSV